MRKFLAFLIMSCLSTSLLAETTQADAASETDAAEAVRNYFPPGKYRKLFSPAGCQDGSISWIETNTMKFGSGPHPDFFHAFSKSTKMSNAPGSCSTETFTSTRHHQDSRNNSMSLKEVITQTCKGKKRVMTRNLDGIRHHGKISLTFKSTDDQRADGNLTCKYEKSLN